jgi:hypothetical protein
MCHNVVFLSSFFYSMCTSTGRGEKSKMIIFTSECAQKNGRCHHHRRRRLERSKLKGKKKLFVHYSNIRLYYGRK